MLYLSSCCCFFGMAVSFVGLFYIFGRYCILYRLLLRFRLMLYHYSKFVKLLVDAVFFIELCCLFFFFFFFFLCYIFNPGPLYFWSILYVSSSCCIFGIAVSFVGLYYIFGRYCILYRLLLRFMLMLYHYSKFVKLLVDAVFFIELCCLFFC